MMTREEWDLLSPDDQFVLAAALMARDADWTRLLTAIPACPLHGACVNHAVEWVKRAQGLDSRYVNEQWCCQDDVIKHTSAGV